MYLDEAIRIKERYYREMSKEMKEDLVIACLEDRCPNDQWAAYSRNDIARITGIPRSTVSDILVRLQLQDKVERRAIRSGQTGRDTIYYRLAAGR